MSTEDVYRHSPHTRRILWVMAPIACPPEAVERGLIDPVVDDLESFMEIMPPEIRAAMITGMKIFDATAALHPANMGKTFCELDQDKAKRWFDLWWHSPIALMREFAKKTSGLLIFCYYERPSVRMELAYHPDRWIAKVARERIERYGEEIRTKEAAMTAADPLTAAMISGTGKQEANP